MTSSETQSNCRQFIFWNDHTCKELVLLHINLTSASHQYLGILEFSVNVFQSQIQRHVYLLKNGKRANRDKQAEQPRQLSPLWRTSGRLFFSRYSPPWLGCYPDPQQGVHVGVPLNPTDGKSKWALLPSGMWAMWACPPQLMAAAGGPSQALVIGGLEKPTSTGTSTLAEAEHPIYRKLHTRQHEWQARNILPILIKRLKSLLIRVQFGLVQAWAHK